MKRIVICCDGTWSRADREHDGRPCPTNVVRLAYRVARRAHDDTPQIVYYDEGARAGDFVDSLSGGALGEGFEDGLHRAYRFLITNYERGDEIYLFGFSRGAYTARTLAGMIRKCGILAPEHVQSYSQALGVYRNDDHPDDSKPQAFKASRSVCNGAGVRIRFIGVWDTVGALGIPLRGLRWFTRRPLQFHDTYLGEAVDIACQALAIDERRAPFEPTLWKLRREGGKPVAKPGQTIEQVWFSGSHSEVGGGCPRTGLSDISLAWMMDRASDAGLAFDEDLSAYPPAPNPEEVAHRPNRGLYVFSAAASRLLGSLRGEGGVPAIEPLPDVTQAIHASALERWDRMPAYRPGNLRAYFKSRGDSRCES